MNIKDLLPKNGAVPSRELKVWYHVKHNQLFIATPYDMYFYVLNATIDKLIEIDYMGDF